MTLVVGDTTRINPVVAYGWLKRRRIPQLEQLRGLYIVVSVYQNRWGTLVCMQPISIDDRVAARPEQLHVLGADFLQMLLQPRCTGLNIVPTLLVGANTGMRKRSISEAKCWLLVSAKYESTLSRDMGAEPPAGKT